MNNLQALQDAIRKIHGCASTYIKSVPVEERFQGKVVWAGTVEVFELKDHPKAKECFAWRFEDEKKQEQFVAVLGVAPVIGANSAVQAYIASEFRKRSGDSGRS
jgi:hypothetical protein